MKFAAPGVDSAVQGLKGESLRPSEQREPNLDLREHEFSKRSSLSLVGIGGLALMGLISSIERAPGANVVLAWDNPTNNWAQYGYNSTGWTNIELRLWAGVSSNHFDRYLVIPSSLMSSAQVLGIQPGTRTYFTLTAYVKNINAQSDHSNIALYDSPSSGVPTPIRREATLPTINFDQMTPGTLSLSFDPNPPSTNSVPSNPTNSVPNIRSTLTIVFSPEGTPEISISGTPGKTIMVQRSRDLESWENIAAATIPFSTNSAPGFVQVYRFEDTDPNYNRNNAGPGGVFYRTVE